MEETEKKDIQDAEIDQVDGDQNKKEKNNYRTEIVLILVIGVLLGIMIKAEALKRISIGFNDYKVISRTQEYDIEAIEKQLVEEAKKVAEDEEEAVMEEEYEEEQGPQEE